jgi:glycosyltransferase involved in cell wall biosynthesis
MNILYILHKDPDIFLGGIERHTLDLIRVLSLKELKTYLIFPSASAIVVRDFSKGKIEEVRYKGLFCDDMELQNPVVEKSFSEILRKFSIDIVHFQHLQGLPLSLIEVAKNYGAKVIISLHDYYFWCPNYKLLSPLGNKGLSFCFFEKDDVKCAKCLDLLGKKDISAEKVRKRREYVDRILCISDDIVLFSGCVQDIFYALYNSSGDKTMIIEHGVEAKNDLPPVHRSGSGFNVAYLGAFTYEKGADIFIEIVRRAKSRYPKDKVNFFIIGELGYHLPNDLLRLKGSKSLKVTGAYRPHEVGRLLKGEGIDLIMLLSRWPETYSYTLSEAIINGVPVMASDLGALRERVAKYAVGYLVPYENPVPRILKIIDDFLVHPELLSFFKQRCAIAKRKLPDLDEMVMKYFELYKH